MPVGLEGCHQPGAIHPAAGDFPKRGQMQPAIATRRPFLRQAEIVIQQHECRPGVRHKGHRLPDIILETPIERTKPGGLDALGVDLALVWGGAARPVSHGALEQDAHAQPGIAQCGAHLHEQIAQPRGLVPSRRRFLRMQRHDQRDIRDSALPAQPPQVLHEFVWASRQKRRDINDPQFMSDSFARPARHYI